MIYIIFAFLIIVMLLAVFFYAFVTKAEQLCLESGLREHELLEVYTHTKREFNTNPSKICTELVVIEKCDNVNNIWNDLPHTKKMDITEWAIVFALYHMTKNKIKSGIRFFNLIKFKWKYRKKYAAVQLITSLPR